MEAAEAAVHSPHEQRYHEGVREAHCVVVGRPPVDDVDLPQAGEQLRGAAGGVVRGEAEVAAALGGSLEGFNDALHAPEGRGRARCEEAGMGEREWEDEMRVTGSGRVCTGSTVACSENVGDKLADGMAQDP